MMRHLIAAVALLCGLCGPAAADSIKVVVPFAVKSPMVSQRLAAGGVVGGTDGKGFAARLAQETAYWGPELKKLGISGE